MASNNRSTRRIRPRKGWFPRVGSLPPSETTVEKASADIKYWTQEVKRSATSTQRLMATKNLAEAKERLRFAHYRNIPSAIRAKIRADKQRASNQHKQEIAWKSAQVAREHNAGIGNLALYQPDNISVLTTSKYLEAVFYKSTPDRIKTAAFAACQAARSRLPENTKARRLAAEVILRRLGIIRIEWFYPVFNKLLTTNEETGETNTVYSTYIFDALAVHKSGKWYYVGGISPYVSPTSRQHINFVPAFLPKYLNKRRQTDIYIAQLHKLRFIDLHDVPIIQIDIEIEKQFDRIEQIHQLIKVSRTHSPDNLLNSSASNQMSGVENPPLISVLPTKTSLSTPSDRGCQTRQQTLTTRREPDSQLMVNRDRSSLNANAKLVDTPGNGYTGVSIGGRPQGEVRSLATKEGVDEISPSFVTEGIRKALDTPSPHVGSHLGSSRASSGPSVDKEEAFSLEPPVDLRGSVYCSPFSRPPRPKKWGRRYFT